MDGKKFTLTKIEGEYAYLQPIDGGDEVFIALAFAPRRGYRLYACVRELLL